MAGRGEIACSRCKELKRRDKLVRVELTSNLFKELRGDDTWLCKHCRAVMISKLRQLEQMALLSE